MLQHGNDGIRTRDRRDMKPPPCHLRYLTSLLFIHGKAMVPYVQLSANCWLDNLTLYKFCFHCTKRSFHSWLTSALMVPVFKEFPGPGLCLNPYPVENLNRSPPLNVTSRVFAALRSGFCITCTLTIKFPGILWVFLGC